MVFSRPDDKESRRCDSMLVDVILDASVIECRPHRFPLLRVGAVEQDSPRRNVR